MKKKAYEKQPCEHRGQWRRKGRKFFGCQRRGSSASRKEIYVIMNIYTATCKGPHTRVSGYFLKVLPPVKNPCWSRFSMIGRSQEWKKKKIIKMKLEKEGGGRKVLFLFCLCFLVSKSILTDNTLNSPSPSQVWFACDSNCWVISFSSSRPKSFFILVSPPSCWGKKVREWLGGHPAASQGHATT